MTVKVINYFKIGEAIKTILAKHGLNVCAIRNSCGRGNITVTTGRTRIKGGLFKPDYDKWTHVAWIYYDYIPEEIRVKLFGGCFLEPFKKIAQDLNKTFPKATITIELMKAGTSTDDNRPWEPFFL